MSLVAAIIGCIVFVAWLLDIDVLKSVVPHAAMMKPNTALCFILSSSALFLLCTSAGGSAVTRRGRIVAARVLAALVVLIGLATFAEHLLAVDLGIDTVFFTRSPAAADISNAVRMAPASSFNFMLLGVAILILDVETRGGGRPSQFLAFAGTLVGLVGLIGSVFDVHALYRLSIYSSMAIHTSMLFVVLGLAILAARANRGVMAGITSRWMGGVMARRLVPVVTILPFVIGWIRLEGERAGLYTTEIGLTLFVVSTIVIFTTMVLHSARSLNRLDAERHEASEALLASERCFRALIERSANGIALVDANATILYVSPSSVAIEGFESHELVGHSVSEHTHPDDQQAMREVFKRVLADPGRPFQVRLRRRHKDGRWLWQEGVLTNQLADPSVGGIIVNFSDVTDRKLAEEALSESQERFSKAFHASPAGMTFIRLRDLQYVDVNDSWLQMIGYDREEVVGHTADELGVSDAVDRADRVRRIVANGDIRNEEAILTTKLGEVRNFLISAQLVTLQSEPYLIGVYIDITARNRAEEARLRLEAQLLQSQKMEALGTLASGIAHDFNNILTAIVGNTRLAREDLPADSPVQQSLAEVYMAGVRAADLVKRILAFSRQQEPRRRTMQLRPVIEEALELLRATLPATINIHTAFASKVPMVSVDPTQIHQVVMNLGTNAAHAIGEEGGILEIHLDAVTVLTERSNIAAKLADGEYVRLSVTDNGAGIDKAILQRIFEPFFTTKELGEGTGLGLSVVHGIVQNHGGTVTVFSELGRGTAFHLYFPAAAETAGADRARAESTTKGQGERILYVDDETAIVTMITHMLNRMGYSVTGYSSATQALEAFRAGPDEFDAVITDLSMPGLAGPELARKILEIRRNIPILMTSGYLPEEEMDAVRRIGIHDFIPKPTSFEQVGRILARIFGRYAEPPGPNNR
ncbi:MAG TPA: PAS domain S-box protein [Candidatus Kapabacteria bacterium]|nr:PAS domain S-box protein [Candidatus Kapabacteria bacterium]